MRLFSIVIVLVGLATCIGGKAERFDKDERFHSGYDDGYAAGYNSECVTRITLIEGDFDNEYYSRGYSAGHNDGAAACRRGD